MRSSRARLVTITPLALALCASPATAQTGGAPATPPKAAGPAPKAADGHPDLSGVWWPGRDLQIRPLGSEPPAAPVAGGPRRPSFAGLYQPWALEKAKSLGDKDDPSLRCVPTAFGTLNASLLDVGFVGQIVQTPKFVVFLTETYHGFRIIPVDGRPHRDDVAPSYKGDEIGRWEGDTLVIDTVGFNERFWMNRDGLPHTSQLHLVERLTRVDFENLNYEVTIDDPGAYTAPWTSGYTLGFTTGAELFEYQCQENNLSPESMIGDALTSAIVP